MVTLAFLFMWIAITPTDFIPTVHVAKSRSALDVKQGLGLTW